MWWNCFVLYAETYHIQMNLNGKCKRAQSAKHIFVDVWGNYDPIPVWQSIVLSFSSYIYRGGQIMGLGFGEFYPYCCCSPHLPQLAWNILTTMGPLLAQPCIHRPPFHPQDIASRLGFRRYTQFFKCVVLHDNFGLSNQRYLLPKEFLIHSRCFIGATL